MRRLFALSLLWCALGQTAAAQETPPQAEAAPTREAAAEKANDLMPELEVSVSPKDKLALGDLLTLKVQATVPANVEISVPEQPLSPFEVHARRAQVADLGAKRRFEFELDLLVLETGPLTVPALTLRAVSEEGALTEVKTAPIPIHVESLIANEPNAEPKGPTQPVVVMQDDYTLLWVVGGLLAVAAVAGLTLLVRRWLERRPKAAPPPPPALPPWDVALQKLAALDAKKADLLAARRGEEFVDGVSDALREYLGKRYGFEGLESTTDEVVSRLERLRPHKLSLSGVSLLLEQCDLVKFARMEPDLAQCDDLWNGAVGLIRATTPAPEPTSAAENAS